MYIREKRIQQAKTLLDKSNTPIKEIARACGFKYVEVFYRIFKKEFRITPLNYRQNKQKKQCSGKAHLMI